MPEVTLPDWNWLPSDHHDVEVEDQEAAVDPWSVPISEKGTSDETPPPVERDAYPVSPKARLKLFNALEAWPLEDDDAPVDFDSAPPDSTENNDVSDDPTRIFEGDPSDDEFGVETDDGGFEDFVLDKSPDEEMANGFDIGEFDPDARRVPWEMAPEEKDERLRRRPYEGGGNCESACASGYSRGRRRTPSSI